jgi:membrane protein DedA with SNARE-associated domain
MTGALAALGPLAVLFPAMLLEGPVATLVAGSLVGAGVLAWSLAWLAAVAADLVVDSALYALGRSGSRAPRLLTRLGLTEARWTDLRGKVHGQLPRVVIGSKLVDAGAVPAFLATGMAGVPYRRFMTWNVPVTAVRAGLLVGLGALVGRGLADTVLAHPWLAVLGGVALGAVLLGVRALVGTITR